MQDEERKKDKTHKVVLPLKSTCDPSLSAPLGIALPKNRVIEPLMINHSDSVPLQGLRRYHCASGLD